MPNDPRILQNLPGDTFAGGETPQLPALFIGMPIGNAAANSSLITDAQGRLSQGTLSSGTSGTVTSVALALPAEFTVTGSPVTTTGTLTGAWATQTANRIFAGPGSGAAAVPTFRAMVALDLPNTAVVAGSYTLASFTVDAQGRLTAASSGSAATQAYWRWRYYAKAFAPALLDSTYFLAFGPNLPGGGITPQATDKYTDGRGGSHLLSVGDSQLVFWNRIGLQNTSGADITVNFYVIAHDDSLVILNEYGTDLGGTITAIAAGAVTGAGSNFTGDFVVGDYVKLNSSGDILRWTVLSTTTTGNVANTPGIAAFPTNYRLMKKLYSATAANAAVNTAATATIKAGQTHIIHILGNNNTGTGEWMVAMDALTITGISFVDPGA